MVFTGCGDFKHGGGASGEHSQAEPGNEGKALPRPIFMDMAETMTKAKTKNPLLLFSLEKTDHMRSMFLERRTKNEEHLFNIL